jgi:hypothetical protein
MKFHGVDDIDRREAGEVPAPMSAYRTMPNASAAARSTLARSTVLWARQMDGKRRSCRGSRMSVESMRSLV